MICDKCGQNKITVELHSDPIVYCSNCDELPVSVLSSLDASELLERLSVAMEGLGLALVNFVEEVSGFYESLPDSYKLEVERRNAEDD